MKRLSSLFLWEWLTDPQIWHIKHSLTHTHTHTHTCMQSFRLVRWLRATPHAPRRTFSSFHQPSLFSIVASSSTPPSSLPRMPAVVPQMFHHWGVTCSTVSTPNTNLEDRVFNFCLWLVMKTISNNCKIKLIIWCVFMVLLYKFSQNGWAIAHIDTATVDL